MVSIWSFKVYWKASYVAVHTLMNLLKISKHGTLMNLLKISKLCPLTLHVGQLWEGQTHSRTRVFYATKENSPSLPFLVLSTHPTADY